MVHIISKLSLIYFVRRAFPVACFCVEPSNTISTSNNNVVKQTSCGMFSKMGSKDIPIPQGLKKHDLFMLSVLPKPRGRPYVEISPICSDMARKAALLRCLRIQPTVRMERDVASSTT